MFLKDELEKWKIREQSALKELTRLARELEKRPENVELLREQSKYLKIASDAKAHVKFKKRASQKKYMPSEKKWSPILPGNFGQGKRR